MSRLFSITSVQQCIHPVSLFQRFVQQQHVRLASVQRQPASRLVSYPSSVTSFQHCHLSIRISNIFTFIQLHVCLASHLSSFMSVQLHIYLASRSHSSSFTFASSITSVPDHIHPRLRLSQITSISDHIHPRSCPFQITSIPDHIHLRPRSSQITFI